MTEKNEYWWKRFQELSFAFPKVGLTIDLSRVRFPDGFLDHPELMSAAFRSMAELEAGAIANPDENRRVGHYWLRTPALAPSKDISKEITSTLDRIRDFTVKVHSGSIGGARGPFRHVLLIGIGGSALGPQFVSRALGIGYGDQVSLHFLDNTDPDGIDSILNSISGSLGQTLCVVISKSGGTKETRNGMLEVQAAYRREALDFGKHAVAITKEGSQLDQVARGEGWIDRFPMWDWVGGRTSETSAVGLLPAALQGIDIDGLLEGAARCDEATRVAAVRDNPAALLALAWFHCGRGVGAKTMVILPYKDRLDLLAKYLQQLIMESLGKKLNVNGMEVKQGIAVMGNKGSTDQHSYVQQLVDGVDNAFVIFVQVGRDRNTASMAVETDITSGDYLHGFLLGTRQALQAGGRDSITISIPEVTPSTVGSLIALFERAVGFYASLVNINAYHQPGVEAGKVAAEAVIELTQEVIRCLRSRRGKGMTVEDISKVLGPDAPKETLFHVCEHLVSNPDRGVRRVEDIHRFGARYEMV